MNDPLSPVIPPLQIVAAPHRVEFADRRPDFRRLIMRGAFLELITVGFYRFWLATDMRPPQLASMARTIPFEALPSAFDDFTSGRIKGRVVVAIG